MKIKLVHLVLLLTGLCLVLPSEISAQSKKKSSSRTSAYPTAFQISKTEFDQLFSLKPEEKVASSNTYLNGSTVLMNTLNGDMKFLKLKLNYFKNAFLMIQINGVYSTQIFILSQDKSVFYKGKVDKDMITMSKCNEDDIVSE